MRLSLQIAALAAVVAVSALFSIYVIKPALSGDATRVVEKKVEFRFLVDAPLKYTVETVERVKEGSTALDALLATPLYRSVEYSGGLGDIYISAVNDIRENATHSWRFYINDAPANASIADYVPREGDFLKLILEERA